MFSLSTAEPTRQLCVLPPRDPCVLRLSHLYFPLSRSVPLLVLVPNRSRLRVRDFGGLFVFRRRLSILLHRALSDLPVRDFDFIFDLLFLIELTRGLHVRVTLCQLIQEQKGKSRFNR